SAASWHVGSPSWPRSSGRGGDGHDHTGARAGGASPISHPKTAVAAAAPPHFASPATVETAAAAFATPLALPASVRTWPSVCSAAGSCRSTNTEALLARGVLTAEEVDSLLVGEMGRSKQMLARSQLAEARLKQVWERRAEDYEAGQR
ncbi:unnamed protein product, partial [Phaeothamnion confervicola]